MINKINLKKKFKKLDKLFKPGIISEYDDYYIKIANIKGEFIRHKHNNSAEIFIIHKGKLEIHFDDKVVKLKKGEMINIPKNIYHKPIAKKICEIILIEKKDTINTGNIKNNLTQENLDWI